MNQNQFTKKSLEALQGAQDTAREYGNQQIEQAHLLYALLRQEEVIIANAYDPLYGARPLRRYLQHTVETLVSRRIIAGRAVPGEKMTVDGQDGQLTIV